MNLEDLENRLRLGGVVPLSAGEWGELAQHLPVVERHQTQLAGELLIVKMGDQLVAVEAPSRDARVARLLGGADEARAFVNRRMEEYERMWDGCGVKVDYYEEPEED